MATSPQLSKKSIKVCWNKLIDLDLDEVKAVLHRVQNFDPPGVAAIDLADCLGLQLRQMPEDTPGRAKSLRIGAWPSGLFGKT